MIKKSCPECGSLVVVDESHHTEGEVVKTECQLCGTAIEFVIPHKAENAREAEPESKTVERETQHKSSEKGTVNHPGPQQNSPAQPTIMQEPEPESEPEPDKKRIALWSIIAVLILIILGMWYSGHSSEPVTKEDDRNTDVIPVESKQQDTEPMYRETQAETLSGSYKVDGKLDGTYPFAMDITVNGSSVTGTYYSEATRNKPAGTISGRVYDNSLDIYVTTSNKLSRTFEGTFDGNSYKGKFVSGYDGAVRRFSATIH